MILQKPGLLPALHGILEYGDNVLPLEPGVPHSAQFKGAVDQAYEHFGRLDIIV